MREILFRGKRIDNGEWVYGNLNYGTIEIKSIKDSYYISDFGVNPWDKKFYPVIPESVGQYTGMTDKNGKNIFEGDIVKQRGFLNNYYSSVWYAAGRFLVRDYETLLPTALGGISRYEIEVIGNIHDNPELLEGKS